MNIYRTTVREFYEKMYAGIDLNEGPRFIEIRKLQIVGEETYSKGSEWHNSIDSILDEVKKQPKGLDYYYGVHLRDGALGTREAVSLVTTLHADLDFKDKPYREWQEILKEFKYPVTVVVHSGNGLHAYWFLKKPYPVDDDSRRGEVEAFQCGLQMHLGADTTHDLPRILRIPGSINYKDPEHPKQCEIMFADYSRIYQLSQFVEFHPLPSTTPKGPAPPVASEIPQGCRNQALASLAGTMQRRAMSPAAIEKALLAENLAKCNPPLAEKEVLGIVKSVLRYAPDPYLGRLMPSREDVFGNVIEREQAEDLDTVKIADVEATSVDFLWHPYIPIGKLTFIDGDPGVGKSWLTQALATAVSTGCGVPHWYGEISSTLLVAQEDGASDTVRPRLESMGANLEMIYLTEQSFVLDDLGITMLRKKIDELRPTLVIIDPLVAYLGNQVDMNAANEVRAVLARLAALAEEFRCAVVCVRHLRKSGGKDLYRGHGSIDFVAAARSVLLVEFEEDDLGKSKTVRVIRHIKCNVAAMGMEQFYTIIDGVFRWGSNE